MPNYHYVGLDVHKKVIAYCVKRADGRIVREGEVAATRDALASWSKQLPRPWIGVMEATLFTGWIYDFLLPRAHELENQGKTRNSHRLFHFGIFPFPIPNGTNR